VSINRQSIETREDRLSAGLTFFSITADGECIGIGVSAVLRNCGATANSTLLLSASEQSALVTAVFSSQLRRTSNVNGELMLSKYQCVLFCMYKINRIVLAITGFDLSSTITRQ